VRIGWVIKWIDGGYTIEQIAQAIERTSVYQQDQEGIIYHTLYQITHPVFAIEALEEYYTPTIVKDYDPDLAGLCINWLPKCVFFILSSFLMM